MLSFFFLLFFLQDIHLQALCKLSVFQKRYDQTDQNLNQRHYDGYLRLNNTRADKRQVFIPIQLVNKLQTSTILEGNKKRSKSASL